MACNDRRRYVTVCNGMASEDQIGLQHALLDLRVRARNGSQVTEAELRGLRLARAALAGDDERLRTRLEEDPSVGGVGDRVDVRRQLGGA